MDTAAIRSRSAAAAHRLGVEVPGGLPLLDHDIELRPLEELVERCLVLNVVVAVAHGFDRSRARDWLEREGVGGAVSEGEGRYLLRSGCQDDEGRRGQVEALWALVWTLGQAPALDFSETCPDDLVLLLPDLLVMERALAFRERSQRRPLDEVAAAVDLAYCLDHAIRDSVLSGSPPPGHLPGWIITERRRALEWATSEQSWDEPTLDT
jgi:hypothetical protein